MLGVEDYGSGSESEEEKAIEMPEGADSRSSISTKPSAPPREKRPLVVDTTSVSKTRRPKKITIGLPSLPNSDDGTHDEPPPAKKTRIAGVGASSLLSMLPAPKQANPSPQRILGGKTGPSLVFNSAIASREKVDDRSTLLSEDKSTKSSSPTFLPPSIAKGKANVSLEDHSRYTSSSTTSSQYTVDPFSLGTTLRAPGPSAPSTSSSTINTSSAPEVPTFVPPEPTPTDPYPGYYRLPSGAWATYDTIYYTSFLKKWQDEYDAHVRALEKGTAKGFEGYDNSKVQDVDTQKEMEKAKIELKAREERKSLTKGAGAGPSAPNMKITASKMSGIAKSRHQLATLLREAYQNREALEDKIAEGRRNRKEAGNKYGF